MGVFTESKKSARLFITAAALSAAIMGLNSGGAAEADPVAKCIDDLRAGPSVYYTPEAASYYASFGNYSVSGSSIDKEAAQRSFRACVKLSGMTQSQAGKAIPVLIDYFPRAVHVVLMRNAVFSYGDQGSYDDCVSTYVMNAKNQVLLSSPFLDYGTLSLCENFVESTYETEVLSRRFNAAGVIVEAVFNLKIFLNFYAGECALSRLTGMSLGHNPVTWRQTWNVPSSTAPNFGAYTAPSASSVPPSSPSYSYQITGPNTVVITKSSGPGAAPAYSVFPEIVVKGKYRLSLKTGDDLIGTVESRNDTSLVFETNDGKPYSFKFSLIQSCQVISVPAPGSGNSTSSSGFSMEPVSYDELKSRASANPAIEVRIASGSSFKGRLISINDEELKMDVNGSLIPFAKDVVKQIFVLPNAALQKKDAAPPNYGKPQGGLLNNPTAPAAPVNAGDEIARYAKLTSCPNGMVFVDLPPGRTSSPFLRVCIDKYEYPDRAGGVPQVKISLDEARSLCEQQGKRLCTEDEWKWACSGLEGRVYPYGNSFIEGRCNNDTRQVESSGSKANCVSPFGGYDMAGNIFEWVTASNGRPALMGGPYSKCQNVSYAQNGDAKPQSGVRCCKSN